MDPNLYGLSSAAWPLAATALCLFILGLFVLHRENYSPVSRAFFLAFLSAVVWLGCFSLVHATADPDAALFWSRLAYLGVPFIPAAITQFAVRLVGFRRPRVLPAVWIASALFSVGFLSNENFISGIQKFSWGYYPRYGVGGLAFVLYFAALLTYDLGLFRDGMREAPSARHRLRAKAFFTAFCFAFLGAVDYLPKFGFDVYPYGYAAIFLVLVMCAWINWRYRLVDITPAFAAEKILETLRSAVVVTDFYGIVRVANSAALQLLGQSATSLVGHTLKSRGLHFAPRGQSEAPSIPYHGHQTLLRRTDGAKLELELSAAWLTDAAGTRIGIVYVATDVTQSLRDAAELTRTSAEREQLELLASIAAHDLRAPINHIGSYSDLAAAAMGSGDASGAAAYLEKVKRAAARMQSLLDGLMRYERAALIDMQEGDVDLNDLLADVRASLPPFAGEDRLVIARLPRVRGSVVQLRQLFENLIANASKFRKPGQPLRVEVFASASRDGVSVSVRDNGIGFRKEDAERVFRPFERLHDSAADGHGLGLAICRRIVTLHGGRIDVETAPGEGTEFIIILPGDRLVARSTGSAA